TAPTFSAFGGPVDPSDDQTAAVLAWSTAGDPDSASLTFSCTLDGVGVGCGPTGANLGTKTARVNPYVFQVTATDPAGNQTSMTHSWHVYQRTVMVADPVIPGLARLTATLSESVSGHGIANQRVVFSRGHTPGGLTVMCSGSADGSATTNSSGVATCDIS